MSNELDFLDIETPQRKPLVPSTSPLSWATVNTPQRLKPGTPFKSATSASVSAESFTCLPVGDDLLAKLHPYQSDGVQWLFHQHKTGAGCLLADEMGLGKTVQAAVFLGALLRHDIARTCVVVVPTTLLETWKDALLSWGGLRCRGVVECLHAEKRAQRELRWARLGHGVPVVIVTTYGLMKRDVALIAKHRVDYIVLDEAHTIKDPMSEVSKAALQLNALHKIGITGTPLMNKFQDLWSLFEFIDPTVLNVTTSQFRAVDGVIRRANEKDSRKEERDAAAEQLQLLQHKLFPRMLRREKNMFSDTVVKSQKYDIVLWVEMTQVQLEQYTEFFTSEEVQTAVRELQSRQPLALLNALKNITNHAWLNFTEHNYREAMVTPFHALPELPEFGCIEDSAKFAVALALTQQHASEGKKTLVFSRSKRLLDMFMFLLTVKGLRAVRLDGDVPPAQRAAVVKQFSSCTLTSVCLLTTQVGGVGLTLNCASRVVLLDPSWNPALDAQAADRVHRVGQTDDVVVYRLITAGTVDEKIYRNQVFKLMAAQQSNPAKSQELQELHRHFTKVELRSMFELGTTNASDTASQLNALYSDNQLPPELLHSIQKTERVVAWSNHGELFGIKASKDSGACSQAHENEEARATPVQARRRVRVAPPSAPLSELANELADYDSSMFDAHTRCAPVAGSMRGRCSILRQAAKLDDIMLESLSLTHFMFRGIPIRKLQLDDIDECRRRSECLSEAFLESREQFEDDDADDLPPANEAHLVDWARLEDDCRPSHVDRRNAAVASLRYAVRQSTALTHDEESDPK